MLLTGDTSRDENPTKYREPSFYHQLLQSVSIATDDANGQYVFEIIMCKSLQTYIKVNDCYIPDKCFNAVNNTVSTRIKLKQRTAIKSNFFVLNLKIFRSTIMSLSLLVLIPYFA